MCLKIKITALLIADDVMDVGENDAAVRLMTGYSRQIWVQCFLPVVGCKCAIANTDISIT